MAEAHLHRRSIPGGLTLGRGIPSTHRTCGLPPIPLIPLTAALLLAGCWDDEDDAAPDLPPDIIAQMEQAERDMERDAREVDQGLSRADDELSVALRQLQGEASAGVEPVPPGILATALPQVAGWERSPPRGQLITFPYRFATAGATYRREGARITLELVDSGKNPVMTLPFSLLTQAGYSAQSDDGYERATQVGGRAGWERWEAGARTAALGLLVGERFMATFEASDVTSAAPLRAFVEAADLSGLDRLTLPAPDGAGADVGRPGDPAAPPSGSPPAEPEVSGARPPPEPPPPPGAP